MNNKRWHIPDEAMRIARCESLDHLCGVPVGNFVEQWNECCEISEARKHRVAEVDSRVSVRK